MIDVKQAVTAAKAYVSELFPSGEALDLRLEEVEHSQETNRWEVTLSFLMKRPLPEGLRGPMIDIAVASVLAQPYDRVYKTIGVEDQTGEVISMKIRILQ
jgi:hypothetical protein